MLRVTIESVSANDGSPKKLATMDICNQSPLDDIGDYTFSYKPVRDSTVCGILRRHNRNLGFLSLVIAAFKVLER